MDAKRLEDLQGWGREHFGPEVKLGSLARMPPDVLTEQEIEMLEAAREGWLVGLEEGCAQAPDTDYYYYGGCYYYGG